MQPTSDCEKFTEGMLTQGDSRQSGTLIHVPSRQRAVGALGEYPVWQEMAQLAPLFVGRQRVRFPAFAMFGSALHGKGSQVGRLIQEPL
jgi:hypothetical protein